MQGNEKEEVLKKRQFLSAQVDLSKFNKSQFEKATDEEKSSRMLWANLPPSLRMV